MARIGHQWTQPRSTKYRSHSPRSDFLSAKHAVRRREPTFAQLCPKIGASSEHVVPIRHTKELHQSRGILAGSPHIHAKVVLQDPVLPYMFIIEPAQLHTVFFPKLGWPMPQHENSSKISRTPKVTWISKIQKSVAAICVCRCMATWFPQNMVWLSGLLGLPCTWPFTCTFSEHICPAQNTQSCQHIRYSSLELPYPFMVDFHGFPHWTNGQKTLKQSHQAIPGLRWL
jgi:hypothetical protein